MKIVAKFNSKLIDEENNIITQFKITDWLSKKRVEQLDKTKEYQLEIKEAKSKRTLEQNAKLWLVIHEIAEEARTTDYQVDEMKIYIDLLKETNCKYEWIKTPSLEVYERLKQSFRATEYIRKETIGNREEHVIKCYLGSSKFNTKEMSQLIEIAEKWLYELNSN